MTIITDDELDRMEQDSTFDEEYRIAQKLNDRRRRLKDALTPDVIAILENIFRTDLPCFLNRDPESGERVPYDPLDAMRRDAHREFILKLQSEISLYKEDFQ